MAKVDLSDVSSGYNRQRINTNFEDIETELNDKVLYRDNPDGEANQMENDFDMNSNDILNANDVSASRIIVDGVILTPDTASTNADEVNYDNSSSTLSSEDVQGALDELGTVATYDQGTGEGEIPVAEDVVLKVDSIADLSGLSGVDGQQIQTTGYIPGSKNGGNTFSYDSSLSKSLHDGVKYISNTVPYNTDLDIYRSGSEEADAGGTGVFVSLRNTFSACQAGATGDGVADDTSAIAAATAYGPVLLPDTTRITELVIAEGGSIFGGPNCATVYCENETGRVNVSPTVDSLVDNTTAIENINFIAEGEGGQCIATPTGSSVAYVNRARYNFNNLLFRGTTSGTSSSVWEYVEGWNQCIQVGECFSTRINKMNVYGCYDITQDPSLSIENVGIKLEGDSTVRAVRITNYQTSDCKTPIEIGENVTSWFLSDFDFSRSYNGITSSHIDNSGETQINQGYVNAQTTGINLYQRSWSFIDGVNVTRHPSGYDYSDDWTAVKLTTVNDASVSNMRIIDPGTWTNVGTRTAYQFDSCNKLKLTSLTCDASDGNLDYGFYMDECIDLVFTNIVFDDVDTHFYFGTGCYDISVGEHNYRGSVTNRYLFDSSITTTQITNNFQIKGMHVNAITYGNGNDPTVNLQRSGGQQWQVKITSGDSFLIRDVTNTTNKIELVDGSDASNFNIHVQPGTDDTYNLGSSSKRWANIYAELPVYADESAATTGGLNSGQMYRTSTGEIRIKL